MRTKAIALLLFLAVAAMSSAEETPTPMPAQITVNVLGAVNKPSRVTLPKGATILDALASAGGETTAGDLSKVKLIRRSIDQPDLAEINVKKILNGTAGDVVLRDGDTINVLKSSFK